MEEKNRKRLLILAAIILLALIAGVSYFILSSKSPQTTTSPTEDPSKTWELVLTYNNKLNILSLEKLSLLDKTVRPSYRGLDQSPYELFVRENDQVLYQHKISISEQVIYNLIYDPKNPEALPATPDEIGSTIYIPYYPSATKIQINKNSKPILSITVKRSNSSIDLIPSALAIGNANNSCQPLQVVFISDNYTNFSTYRQYAKELMEAFKSTSPFNSHANLFDFQIIDNTRSLGCQNGLAKCLVNPESQQEIYNLGKSYFPNADKFIVLVNNPNAELVDQTSLGVTNGIGGSISIVTNRTDRGRDAMTRTAVHEFLGHAVSALYDRYVVDINKMPQYNSIQLINTSNCTDSATGDPKWTQTGVSGAFAGCSKKSWYAPTPLQCPYTPGESTLLNGGNKTSIMSAEGCNGSGFDAVETQWINTVMLPQYLQGCSNSEIPPQGDCKIADAHWKSSDIACTNPSLEVITEGNCNGKSLTFSIEEDDGTLGPSPEDDPVDISYLPPNDPIEIDNSTDTTWNPEIPVVADETSDPLNNISYEYYFTASIIGETTSFTSTLSSNTAGKLLAVNPADIAACHTPIPTPTSSPPPSPSSRPSPLKTSGPTPKPIKIYNCVEVTPSQPGRQIQLTMLECSIKN